MAKKAAKNRSKTNGSKGPRRRASRAKSEQVEVGDASTMGLNLPPVNDMLFHLKTIKGLKEKSATAASHLRHAKNRAKEAGFDIDVLEELIANERADPLVLQTRYAQLEMGLRATEAPVQIKTFDYKQSSPEDQAKSEGYRDGRKGKTQNTTRWPEGAPGHEEYKKAWLDGQKDLIDHPEEDDQKTGGLGAREEASA